MFKSLIIVIDEHLHGLLYFTGSQVLLAVIDIGVHTNLL